MAIDNISSPEMASNNVNKIVRTNLNLNSKILSKNTTEILNTCIGKLYKQMPLEFQKNLDQGKPLATAKPEDHASIERLKMHVIPRINVSKPQVNGQMLKTFMTGSQKSTNLLPKKVTKSAGYKICNYKRYCSSHSSSSGSVLRRYDDSKRFTRAYHTRADHNMRKPRAQKSPLKHLKDFSALLPVRNQHMSTSAATWRQALEVSNHIREDLMSVDEEIRNRLKIKPVTPTITTNTKLCAAPSDIYKNLRMSTMCHSELKEEFLTKPSKLKDINMDSCATSDGQNFKNLNKLLHKPLTKPTTPIQIKKRILEPKQPKTNPLSAASHKKQSSVTSIQIDSTEQQQQRENKEKNVPKKRRTTLRNCVPPDESVIKKPVKNGSYKGFQVNGKVTPSATYCLAKPWNVDNMKYIT